MKVRVKDSVRHAQEQGTATRSKAAYPPPRWVLSYLLIDCGQKVLTFSGQETEKIDFCALGTENIDFWCPKIENIVF